MPSSFLSGGIAMALLRCEVAEGPRPGFKTIAVPSVEGHSEFLTIEERLLSHRNGSLLLPVSVVGKDERYDTVLIQLPLEADSGANRVWVRSGALISEAEPGRVPA
jgi:hypothetical protein